MTKQRGRSRRGQTHQAVDGEPVVRLARKLERVLRQGHPWVWRDALVDLSAPAGTVVTVVDAKGGFVARGIADDGPIGVRVLTCNPREQVDAALFARRIVLADDLRQRGVGEDTDTLRLLHGEGDRLPGVVCDLYGRCAVLRFDGAGAAAWQDVVIESLKPILHRRGVSTLLVRSGRGHQSVSECAFGDPPEGPFEVRELGMRLLVDVIHGQKTGLFLDHRPSRLRVRQLARGLEVLNLYGYTGAFSIAAGLGGATAVDTVDLAAPALELAEASWALNELPAAAHRCHAADVPQYLDRALAKGARWNLIIADPPSFAPRESAVEAALGAYRKLHTSCLSLLEPGGLYLAASCSSHVRRETFEQTVLEAAGKLRRPLQLLDSWSAGTDHPRLPAFPEGDYLKAVLVRA